MRVNKIKQAIGFLISFCTHLRVKSYQQPFDEISVYPLFICIPLVETKDDYNFHEKMSTLTSKMTWYQPTHFLYRNNGKKVEEDCFAQILYLKYVSIL